LQLKLKAPPRATFSIYVIIIPTTAGVGWEGKRPTLRRMEHSSKDEDDEGGAIIDPALSLVEGLKISTLPVIKVSHFLCEMLC